MVLGKLRLSLFYCATKPKHLYRVNDKYIINKGIWWLASAGVATQCGTSPFCKWCGNVLGFFLVASAIVSLSKSQTFIYYGVHNMCIKHLEVKNRVSDNIGICSHSGILSRWALVPPISPFFVGSWAGLPAILHFRGYPWFAIPIFSEISLVFHRNLYILWRT